MPRYAAFLRGINVSGRRATSDQLCSCFGELRLEDVTTFRASGNVIFTAAGRVRPDELAARIERALNESLGYEVSVFLRTATEIKAIAEHQPFEPRVVEASDGKLQVAMLSAKPTAQARKKALALDSDADRLAIRGRELYWLPIGGISESALGMKGIGDLIGSNTMRTKGTIDQIAARYF